MAALVQKDAAIEPRYLRSPNMKFIHAWLKEQLDLGLSPASVSASYIRRYCLVDGKVLNLRTCKVYLEGAGGLAKAGGRDPEAEPLPDLELDDEDDDEAEEPVARDEKPKLVAARDGDDWRVIITLAGVVEHDSTQAGSKLAAMRAAWDAWEGE